ncbi:unnamed protein product [Rotaria sp. Silwood2]|nr:unnamed protein product [Rotaria sp. Silwood2]CAF2687091.1 unnamed protein product [Rotaria sp. Silwood2]CAF2975805.1 unnamed protein product [Rotaria sp. Silwood2]CAF3080990.1 unnamed protein product [Rotaria sp. Silwood2]CAF4194436.1 unnamed protein product [Rotaria sp. Silwood2]
MLVIDWLQTCEFVRENSERFILYCLCGCLVGISIIFMTIIIVLYIDKRFKIKSDYQSSTMNMECDDDDKPYYLPVYRYNCRTHNDFSHV